MQVNLLANRCQRQSNYLTELASTIRQIIESKSSHRPGKRYSARCAHTNWNWCFHRIAYNDDICDSERKKGIMFENSISWFLFAFILTLSRTLLAMLWNGIITTKSTHYFGSHTQCFRAQWKKSKWQQYRFVCIYQRWKKKNLIISGLICVIKQTTQRDKRAWWRWRWRRQWWTG